MIAGEDALSRPSSWAAAGRLALRGLGRLGLRGGAAALGLCGVVALAGIANDLRDEPTSRPDVATQTTGADAGSGRTPVDADWRRIARPIALFAVSGQELAGQPLRYEALATAAGDREDRLVFGAFRPEPEAGRPARRRAHFAVALRRERTPGELSRGFFVDMVRNASELGLSVERLGQAAPLATKFGSIESAEALLSEDGAERGCVGFRHVSADPVFRIAGWWCPARERAPDPRQLACLIDRIDLIAAGDDVDLRRLFAAAEKRRDQSCIGGGLVAAGRKPSPAETLSPARKPREAGHQSAGVASARKNRESET